RGAMILFSWPARQQLMLYGADVERARASGRHLADLVEQVAANTNAENINILAYSCGAAVVTQGLVELRQRHQDQTPEQLAKSLRVGNVIYAASDIDLKTFAEEQVLQIKQLCQNVMIYIANNDAILGLASLGYGASRLGRPDLGKFTKEQQERAARDAQVQIV